MNLTIDIGNSGSKCALFDKAGRIVRYWPSVEAIPDECLQQADAAIVCASGRMPAFIQHFPSHIPLHVLTAQSRLPLRIDYLTPETLGADRIAAACGAWHRYPNQHSVVIDSGTCITIDWVDADGTFRGGAILPGIEMRYKALNNYTDRLPLLNMEGASESPCGRSTEQCMRAGVLQAVQYEIAGFIDYYQSLCGSVAVVSTGGIPLLPNTDKMLVMSGLNEILQIN